MEDFTMRYARCAIRRSDWEVLTPSQKGALMQQLVRQAHATRTRAIGRMLLGWARYIRSRRQRRELAELAAMDNLSLRDAGINRFEIGRAIRSGARLGCANRG